MRIRHLNYFNLRELDKTANHSVWEIRILMKFLFELFLALLHEVHRAIVVTWVVHVYVYVCVRITLFSIKFLKLLCLDSH